MGCLAEVKSEGAALWIHILGAWACFEFEFECLLLHVGGLAQFFVILGRPLHGKQAVREKSCIAICVGLK